jgi:hypothetical protein
MPHRNAFENRSLLAREPPERSHLATGSSRFGSGGRPAQPAKRFRFGSFNRPMGKKESNEEQKEKILAKQMFFLRTLRSECSAKTILPCGHDANVTVRGVWRDVNAYAHALKG